MCIDSIKYPIILRKRIGCKRKCCRESFCRDISEYIYLILCKWSCSNKSLFGTEICLFCEDIAACEHHVELIRYLFHIFLTLSIRGYIECEMEILLLSTSQ